MQTVIELQAFSELETFPDAQPRPPQTLSRLIQVGSRMLEVRVALTLRKKILSQTSAEPVRTCGAMTTAAWPLFSATTTRGAASTSVVMHS
jgi:hypothetical protein